MAPRKCGDCQLCCTLLPVKEISKTASHHCPHQCANGCGIYPTRPASCRTWSCLWLLDQDAPTSRPDTAHYVIDSVPDFITVDGTEMIVAQIWVDPQHPTAHQDPLLRAWLDANQIAAVVRYDSKHGFVLFPPSITGRGFIEEQGQCGPETPPEKLAALLTSPAEGTLL